jgi:tetratricopeptide (TPR) repeat protein
MSRIVLLIVCLCMATVFECSAQAIDYGKCQSIEDVISKESEEIEHMSPSDHDELAYLYVSRGESHLLNAQYEKALDDFQNANSHLRYSRDAKTLMSVAFRAAFGEVIGYDNLGLYENAEQAIRQLQFIVRHFECDDFIGSRPCQERILLLANRAQCNEIHADSLILRNVALDPNESQPKWWCEKTVKNTTAVLRGLAANIPSSVTRFSALELIKTMEEKAIKCCYAGGLWSACLKPLADKFEQWNRKWKVLGIPPDPAWDSDIK